ncbi:MAG: Crp/Fnr family transcriptional regulator [Rhodospirillaceae bacterium]|nr:Crp/Fnr family transcriptional regulator [Rhodospirillaceae bacterium]
MNQILDVLSEQDRRLLDPHLTAVDLEHKVTLFESGTRMDRIYFVDSGVVSLVGLLADGATAEITTVGREGFVNVGSLLDDDLAIARHTVQVPGTARYLSAEVVRDAADRSPAMRGLLYRYVQALIAQISQSVVCNGVHGIEERMARWLLMTHDRSDGDELLLTQEFLAEMLGVRRPTVTLVARTFQTAGLIRYRRGRITIVDRPGLEEAACECHGLIGEHFRRLIPELGP